MVKKLKFYLNSIALHSIFDNFRINVIEFFTFLHKPSKYKHFFLTFDVTLYALINIILVILLKFKLHYNLYSFCALYSVSAIGMACKTDIKNIKRKREKSQPSFLIVHTFRDMGDANS